MKTLNKVLLGLLTIASTSVFAAEPKIEMVPGEFIVGLKSDTKAFGIMNVNSLAQALGAYVKSTIPSQNLVVIKRPVFEKSDSVIETLQQNPLVEFVEPNYIYRMNKTPNDPDFDLLWGLKNIGSKDSEGKVGVQGMDINMDKAWDIQTGSKKMVVAVIDTGIDYNHPDLKDNMWVNKAELNGQPGVDDDGNGVIDDIHGYNAVNNSGDPLDDQGHGSHCAGTIGAKANNGIGISGVNWDVSLMAVKFLDSEGSGTSEDAIKAIDYATKMGARVMSNSWGGGPKSTALLNAIKRSQRAGALFIVAAGNEYNNNDSYPTYPANYNVSNLISVAAIDNQGRKASFSNYGAKSVHVGAPGVNIYSTTGGSYDSFSGTSMATPHVAGVAALVWSNSMDLSAVQIKNTLLSSVKKIDGLKGKTKTGGIVDAYAALLVKKKPTKPNP